MSSKANCEVFYVEGTYIMATVGDGCNNIILIKHMFPHRHLRVFVCRYNNRVSSLNVCITDRAE